MLDLDQRIRGLQERQKALDSRIVALDARIVEAKRSAAPCTALSSLYAGLGDALYALGQVDARLADAEELEARLGRDLSKLVARE
jgi:hypothetical protein